MFGAVKRSNVHLLQLDDEPASPAPVYAFIGIAAFLAILVFAWFSFAKNSAKPQQVQQVDQSWHQDSEQAAPAYMPQARSYMPPTPQPNMAPPVTVPAPPQYQPSSAPDSPGYMAPWARVRLAPTTVTAVEGGANLNRYAVNESIYFQSANFSLKTVGNHKELLGSVVVVNDTLATIDGGVLWLKIGGQRFNLQRYQGSDENPTRLGPFAVASRDSITCEVMIPNFKGDTHASIPKSIGLDGKIAGAAVHAQVSLSQ